MTSGADRGTLKDIADATQLILTSFNVLHFPENVTIVAIVVFEAEIEKSIVTKHSKSSQKLPPKADSSNKPFIVILTVINQYVLDMILVKQQAAALLEINSFSE